MTGSVVVLIRVSVIVDVLPDPAPLLIPGTTALVHAKVALLLELVEVYVLDTLLHQLSVAGLVMTEVGLTVTARSKVVPAQPLTLGVMRYTTATGSVVVLISVSVIVEVLPEPAALLIPPTTALLQANVAVLLELVEV